MVALVVVPVFVAVPEEPEPDPPGTYFTILSEAATYTFPGVSTATHRMSMSSSLPNAVTNTPSGVNFCTR